MSDIKTKTNVEYLQEHETDVLTALRGRLIYTNWGLTSRHTIPIPVEVLDKRINELSPAEVAHLYAEYCLNNGGWADKFIQIYKSLSEVKIHETKEYRQGYNDALEVCGDCPALKKIGSADDDEDFMSMVKRCKEEDPEAFKIIEPFGYTAISRATLFSALVDFAKDSIKTNKE